MKWLFPAKTFLVGEYVALQGGPALVLTTTPYFQVILEKGNAACDFPINSPAYNLWQDDLSSHDYILHWQDPYRGLGGMGASSAQFLGAYYARSYIKNHPVLPAELLATYFKYAWNGEGIAPSGYDVIAQSMHDCVYIDGHSKTYEIFVWPFADLGYILLHTGKKQATHAYLQSLDELGDLNNLVSISKKACEACKKENSSNFINAINDYYLTLCQLNLVAQHTLDMIEVLKREKDILAVKGCGALGSDILLLLVAQDKLANKLTELKDAEYNVVATNII